ncbi:MAG: MTH938/NDUFAF3 family protein [Legionellaceae bacterium]|nr:MTH938/NDUFAF3 family protein [Legionellaceae bacterium]
MEITLDIAEPNSIKSYDEKSITIAEQSYHNSIIVSKDTIHDKWPIQSISDISTENIQPLLSEKPEIIIIGHSEPNKQIPGNILAMLSKERIGVECMSVGAACRTFNLLLAEHRTVMFGYILGIR